MMMIGSFFHTTESIYQEDIHISTKGAIWNTRDLPKSKQQHAKRQITI
jgi:hypothetical protein